MMLFLRKMPMMWKNRWSGMLVFIAFLFFSGGVQASEFRSFRPILTPALVSGGQGVTGRAVSALKPLSRNMAEKAMSKIIAAWNGNNINSVLGDNFFDKSLLSNAMDSKVPRDARLEVLSIQDTQTLNQQVTDSPSGKLLVSMVSVTAKTQLTFNDPANGYQRREGVNEYIIRIKQRAP